MELLIKIIGASLGSSIAVVFKPGGDSKMKLFQRFLIGVIIGVIASPIIRDWLEWPALVDYRLAAGTLGGLFGYLVLQLLFSEKTHEILKKRF